MVQTIVSPDVVNLQFMPIDHMHLFKNIVDIPHFYRTINRRCDCTIPIANGQSLQLYDATEMRIQHFDQLPCLQTPNVQVLPNKRSHILRFFFQDASC